MIKPLAYRPMGHDALWKSIIEDFFEAFVRFFFSEKDAALIDFTVPPKFLEQKLEGLFVEGDGSRYVDKLVEVRLMSGEKRVLYIHIEVQEYTDKHFNWRMFQYFYRIKDVMKENPQVVTLAILADVDDRFRPGTYAEEGFGNSLRWEFATYKLLDKTPEELLKDNNPFGIIMLTAWYHLQTGHGQANDEALDEQILANKLNVYQQLRQLSGLTREQTVRLLRYIKGYTRFHSQANYSKFDDVTLKDEETKTKMGILEAEQAHYVAIAKEETVKETLEEVKKETVVKLLQFSDMNDEQIAVIVGRDVGFVQSVKAQLEQGKL